MTQQCGAQLAAIYVAPVPLQPLIVPAPNYVIQVQQCKLTGFHICISSGPCLQQADLVFLVYGSGSIGATNFQKQKDFLKQVVGKLNVGTNNVHVGLMEFSNYPSMEFPLSKYTSRGDVMTGIDNMNYMGGGTNTADGIKSMTSQMFSQSSGARSNVPRIAIVITDGKSQSSTLTAAAANQARLDNIGIKCFIIWRYNNLSFYTKIVTDSIAI